MKIIVFYINDVKIKFEKNLWKIKFDVDKYGDGWYEVIDIVI